ncbi:MAG: 50S ribosomal protein L11 methyltransferase [Chitinophagales bacterium]
MRYISYEFATSDEAARQLLIGVLAEVGFDSFEERTGILAAFVAADAERPTVIAEALQQYGLAEVPVRKEVMEQQNWNATWESQFQPVMIAGRVGIRAPFHQPLGAEYELVIEPKMSFGTGHHATTALMVEAMLDVPMQGASVLDFGSGTGVLAILAAKLGVKRAVAIDHEEWAAENARENAERNDVAAPIEVILGDDNFTWNETFDHVFANVNRRVILPNLNNWEKLLRSGGHLLLSGILTADEADVLEAATAAGFRPQRVLRKDGWIMIEVKKDKQG